MKNASFLKILWTSAAFSVLLSSCVEDKTYDFNNLDTEVTILKGVEMPLPDFVEFTMKDIITMDGGSSSDALLSVMENGDYVISMSMEPTSLNAFKIESDVLKLNVNGSSSSNIDLGVAIIPANTPLKYDPNDAEIIQAALGLSLEDMNIVISEDFVNQNVDYSFNWDLSISDFPSQIESIKGCTVSGDLNLSLTLDGIPFEKITIKSGTEIVFPDFMRFSACSNSSFDLLDSYKLRANKDVDIYIGGSGISLPMTLAALDFGENGISAENGTLPLSAQVNLKGQISLDPMDFTGDTYEYEYPMGSETHSAILVKNDTEVNNLTFSNSYSVGVNAVKDATLMLADSAAPNFDESYGFDISGLPDFFSGSNISIGFSDLYVLLGLDSNVPFDFSIGASLKSLKDGSATHEYEFGPLDFDSNSETTYCFYDGDIDKDAIGSLYDYLEIDGIGEIMNPIPSRVEASDFTVSFDQEWLTIQTDTDYGASISAALEAPLAFTSDTHVSFNTDLDLNLSSDEFPLDVEGVFKMTVLNTVPFDFDVSIMSLDENKEISDNFSYHASDKISSGAIGSPSDSEISFNFKLSELLTVRGLRIYFSADSNDMAAGIPLNENQGVKFTNISMYLPDGVTVDLAKVSKD